LVNLYLYTKDEKYLEPIPKAIAWLEKSKIGDNLWARLYEVGTNKPIYGDREDGNKVYYDYAKISEYERKSYSWQGSFGIEKAITYYEKTKTPGERENPENKTSELTPAQRQRKADALAPRVKEVIAGLDDKGRWIRDDMIYTGHFVKNINLLCSYLETCPEDGK
jgi:hypothetical protein